MWIMELTIFTFSSVSFVITGIFVEYPISDNPTAILFSIEKIKY